MHRGHFFLALCFKREVEIVAWAVGVQDMLLEVSEEGLLSWVQGWFQHMRDKGKRISKMHVVRAVAPQLSCVKSR